MMDGAICALATRPLWCAGATLVVPLSSATDFVRRVKGPRRVHIDIEVEHVRACSGLDAAMVGRKIAITGLSNLLHPPGLSVMLCCNRKAFAGAPSCSRCTQALNQRPGYRTRQGLAHCADPNASAANRRGGRFGQALRGSAD
jgi:hypothetical protein